MRLKLLILAIFPIIAFGQANLTYVRSYDSTFSILNQRTPMDTLWKFTKSGVLVKYHLNIPVDTVALKSQIITTLDSSFNSINIKDSIIAPKIVSPSVPLTFSDSENTTPLSLSDLVAKDSVYDYIVGTDSIMTAKLKFSSSGSSLLDIPQSGLLMWDSVLSIYTPYDDLQLNRFYLGTTNPTGTTRLNYDGYLYSTRLVAFDNTGSPYPTIYGKTTSGEGVQGEATDGHGLYGLATTTGIGVLGVSDADILSRGIAGTSNLGIGVQGWSNSTGVGIEAKSKAGNAMKVDQYGTANTTENVINIIKYNSGAYSSTGNILNITDNPSTTGTISGKVLSATIDATERISLNPRSTRTGTAYFTDTDSSLTTGNLFDVRNQGTSVFKVTPDSALAPNLTAKFETVITDTTKYSDDSYSVGAIDIGDVEFEKINTDTLIIGTDTITSGSKEMSLYIHDGSVELTATQNVFAKITGLSEGYNQDDYFTVAGDSVQLAAGDYAIDYSISFSGSTTDDWDGAIFGNNAEIVTGGGWERGMSGTDNGNVATFWKGTISTSTWISFRMMNSINNNNPTITHFDASIRKIK